MEKQRLFKMGMLEKNFLVKALCDAQKSSGPETSGLVKALCDAQKSSGPETSGKVQGLIDKTVNAPKGKLYLSDTEFQYAAQSLNGMRNAYLSAGRSSGGIDRVLAKLMSSKYRNVPVR